MERIHITQFDPGTNQGTVNERGYVSREIQNLQLLESVTFLVSGKPKVRVGKFVEICGELRELQWHKPWGSDEREYWYVQLHGDEKLPEDIETWPNPRSF